LNTQEKCLAALKKQTAKGIKKYGAVLSDNNLMASELAEHAVQEMADGLQYTVELQEKVKALELENKAQKARIEGFCHWANQLEKQDYTDRLNFIKLNPPTLL
jgi:hypothetical protein